jgi:replicative superfamily II helicase
MEKNIKDQEQEQEEKFDFSSVTQQDIVDAIKLALKISPLIKPTPTVINTSFSILKAFFLENKKIVILEAPTGSGKTIIGFITYFAMQNIMAKIKKSKPGSFPVS